MANIIQEHQVVYVEPNALATETNSYSTDFGRVMKSPELEDFCIIVDLEVEVKGRTFTYSNNATSQNIKMECVESTNGQKVRFMEGSKIYLDKERKRYINSLTTNYTDCSLIDIENGTGTAEMFGIEKVDISYNNFMVPEVTIQFIDVRGVSLFAQEEMRHNIVSDGVTNTANNNIEGSFFKAFFTFPYPKFTLKVKGYYGQMVSYELTCSDFRASFNSNSGNFNVTAKFVGYAFSFLNDVMANALLAAPYCEYLGEKYWKDNLGNRFVITDKNGSKVPMVTLPEICEMYKSIQETVQKKISEQGLSNAMKDVGCNPEDIKAMEVEELIEAKSLYQNAIAQLKNYQRKSDGDGNEVITINGIDNSVCIIVDNDSDKDALNAIKEDFDEIDSKLRTFTDKSSKLKNWFDNPDHTFKIKYFEDYSYEDSNNDNSISKGKKVRANKVRHEPIREAIQKRSEDSYKDGTYYDAWTDWDDSEVFLYEDYYLSDILDAKSENNTSGESKSKQAIEKEVADKLTQKEFKNVFKFAPTVENITKIIMAHFETYMHILGRCAENIISSGSKRSSSALGVSLDDFDDSRTSSNSASSNYNIPPFPSVTKEVTDNNGNKKREDCWIGEFGGSDKFEEISLVEGLLNGVNQAAKAINLAASANENDGTSTKSVTSSSVKYPLSYLDLFVNGEDNPFGPTDVSNANEVFAKLALRAFSIMGSQDTNNTNARELGECDAENFVAFFGRNSKIETFKNILNGDINTDKVYSFLNEGKEALIDKNFKNVPWIRGERFIQLYQNTYCTPTISGIKTNDHNSTSDGKGRLLPVKNWTFKSLDDAHLGSKFALGNSNLDQFTSTNSPIRNGKKVDDHALNLIKIMAAPLLYVKNSLSGANNKAYTSQIFKNIEFNKDLMYDKYESGYTVKKDSDGNKESANSIITYDDNGNVNNPSNFITDFNYFFTKPEGYNFKNNIKRAEYFLTHNDIDGGNILSSYVEELANSKGHIEYMPKIILLKIGSYLWKHENDNEKCHNLRHGIKCQLINTFKEWAEKEFASIVSSYELKFKNCDYEELSRTLANLKGKSVDEIEREISKLVDINSYRRIYKTKGIYNSNGNGYAIQVSNRPCDAMTSVNKDLFQIVGVCMLTKFNREGYYYGSDMTPAVKINDLKSYFTGFINVAKKELGETSVTNQATTTISLSNDPDDIKIGVYNYIKLLYDKWVAADTNNKDYKMETMFTDADHTFHFIDSVYNKIGDTFFINVGTLVEMLVNSQTQNGYSMLSLMSNLYASNKFLFLCLQNFSDLSKANLMEKIFTPVPYIETEEPKNHPDFVVIYPYEASAHLDVKGGEYPDDSFYLNESTTWPVMIQNKKPNDLTIPSFGVSYGQEYQSYFKDIQVDMNNPMATEQSIKAKFWVAGAGVSGENNGPRHVTIGQDLFTIYSNNSYQCTVTMLGCAWIQPMMYFVLLNVPMFRGSYMIVKVNHQIQAGNMTTTFTGIRMAKTATRAVRQFVYGDTNDSSNGQLRDSERVMNSKADISNDCKYAYYSPEKSVGEGVDFSMDLGEKLIAHLSENATNNIRGTVCENWTLLDALGAIAWQEFGGYTEKAKTQRAAVVACMYNYRGIYGKDAYRNYIFKSGWRYFEIGGNMLSKIITVSQDRKKFQAGKETVSTVFKSGPYGLLVGKVNKLSGKITLDQVQRGFTTRGTSDSSNVRNQMSLWGETLYAPEPEGGYYHIIGGLNDNEKTKRGFKPTLKNVDENTRLNKCMSGFVESIQDSLKATETYKNAVITGEYGINGIVKIKGNSNSVNNVIFDCIHSTYGDWYESLYWCIGNGKIDDDARSIIVKVVTKKPTNHSIGICNEYNIKDGNKINSVYITQESELNKNLKLSMIKHFKSEGIGQAPKAKTEFKSIIKLDNEKINKIFELGSASSIQSCSSLLGSNGFIDSGALGRGFDGEVTNTKMKKVLSNINSFKSNDFGKQKRGQKVTKVENGEYKGEYVIYPQNYGGCCTSGPTTWYGRAGLSMKWWKSTPPTYEKTESGLGAGFVPVWHGTFAQANSLTSAQLRPGDVMTQYCRDATSKGGYHGAMWTGHDWRSDCNQGNKAVPYDDGRGNYDYAAVLWRKKDFQEPGYEA